MEPGGPGTPSMGLRPTSFRTRYSSWDTEAFQTTPGMKQTRETNQTLLLCRFRFASPRPQTRHAQRSVTSTEPARGGLRGVLTWGFR